MFSIKVHQPTPDGRPDESKHKMHECAGYEVQSNGTGKRVLMTLKDGSTETLDIQRGGMAFVMGDSGKTVEIIRPSSSPRTAVMRGGQA